MKISLYVNFSDIISAKKTLADELNRLVIPDPKHEMYRMYSLNHIFQSLRRSGLDGLELIVPKIMSAKDIQEIKNIIGKNRMPILSIHQANSDLYNISLSEIQRLCKIADGLAAKVVTLHSDTLGDKLFNKEFIFELEKLQKKYRIRFGIENMPKSPFSLSKTYSYNACEFSSAVNKTGLSITLDTTHLGQANSDICGFFKQNKEKIVNIHISDYKKSWLNRTLLLANQTHLPLHKGELDIKGFLKILKEENYQGLITMEINADLNTLCHDANTIKNAFV
jgi:sugar phosphate isomerase/epimerase